jgi:hypothetical protein
MTKSQNGWPVATAGQQDTAPIYGAVTVPNGVLKGDVAVVLREVARRFHTTVEPLVKNTCWGWYVKPIEGSSTVSNHASGTAVDLNADQHPMGVSASHNFSTTQIKACHAIVAAMDGVVRWGGDYTGRPDPMHWEIVGTAAATKKLAAKITAEREDDDMPLTSNDGKTIWNTDAIPNPPFRSDAKTNKTTTADFALGDVWNRIGAIQTTLAAQSKTIAALASKDNVDEGQIITGILAGLGAEQLAAAFTAAGLTPEALAAAIPNDMAQRVVDALGQRISAGA